MTYALTPALLLCLIILSSTRGICQGLPEKNNQRTWTYTYIKSKDGRKADLREFLEKNWFVMDSIAVKQGLFNDYALLENMAKEETREWDFIVAVEYYTRGTYSDIEEAWQKIRSSHTTVLIDGRNFAALGQIVRSEEIVKHQYAPKK